MTQSSPSGHRTASRRNSIASGLCAVVLAFAGATAMLPTAVHAATRSTASVSAAAAHPTRAFWLDVQGRAAATSAKGTAPSLVLRQFRSATLDRASIAGYAAGAPHETSRAARSAPLTISLPAPDGTFQRFTLIETSIMEPGLAARHPDIHTYSGKGIDDPGASMVMSITSLGVHASVRGSSTGPWYVEPYFVQDESLYASYYARDLTNVHGVMAESMLPEASIALNRGRFHGSDKVSLAGSGFAPNAQVTFSIRNQAESRARQTVHAIADQDGTVSASFTADPSKSIGAYDVTATDGRDSATTSYAVVEPNAATQAVTGPVLKNYRLALLTDPSYATYFGPDNVTAAKVVLMNRVNQVYIGDTSIKMILVANNDLLNINTTAAMTGANGPCGATACFTASQAASCGNGTLTANKKVIGLLIGAENFDIGHIGLGVNGGGLSALGVVGAANKAEGCTGIPTPTGDFYAVDYVAHEMGHEYAGNHTFNGTVLNCSTGNRNAATSVEPGSGSSVMAYAGICGTDDLQPHSDPYWSERSFDEFTTYNSAAETNLNEVQTSALLGFGTDGMSFQLSYNGVLTAPIVHGSNYTVAGLKAAIEAVTGTGTITASAVSDSTFTITYAGTLAATDVTNPVLVNFSSGASGFINTITKGGITTKGGYLQTATGNAAPVVTAPTSYTIPIRTPFALTGSATDADGDPITYMWEQNDRGATGTSSGTGLITQPKLNGPLFRQFGTAAQVSSAATLLYNSPGENLTSAADATRVFPDMAQILANNTNAESGLCPTAGATPTQAQVDCFSEYLPNASYVGTASVNASPLSLNFRLTARDGKGGIGSAMTQLVLAPAAGPFLVTSPNTAVTYDYGSTQTVTWNVASTDIAPVNASLVKVSLSTDGGLTWPYVLAAATPNVGQAPVVLPGVATSTARIKVEAVGNVFFDVSNANFTLRLPGDLTGDGVVDCADLAIVKAAFGKRVGQAGYSALADANGDGLVDARDLAYVSQKLPAGTVCH